MIRFNILNLLKKIEGKRGKRVTLKEVSEKSGCDKNALSRMVNHPEIVPSANVIDKLAQYFFHELLEVNESNLTEQELMKEIIKELITIYPDDEKYWKEIPETFRENLNTTSLDAIWDLRSQFQKMRTGIFIEIPKELSEKLSARRDLNTDELISKVARGEMSLAELGKLLNEPTAPKSKKARQTMHKA